MKILIVSQFGYGAWFTLQLQEEGHDVDWFLIRREFSKTLKGIVSEPLLEKPDFSKYDFVLFDVTGEPKLAEESLELTPTIGDGDFQSEAEEDRLFGIEIMEECGINVPPYEEFNDIGSAKRFLRKNNKRYVFKPFGGQNQDTATTYVSSSAEDMLRFLDKLSELAHNSEFLLQEFITGTECSTEGYFNGEEFYLINGTLEEKKFMEGGKGPNTGCSGNLVWAYENPIEPPKIFRDGLGRMKDFLKQARFRGMIDLNTICTDSKLYGLEWTPRLGYDASPTLFGLFRTQLADFLYSISSGAVPEFDLVAPFGAGVRISIPPYPSEIKGKHPEGIPIQGLEFEDCIKECYLYDCMAEGDDLVTAGLSGFVCVPLGVGHTIEEAFMQVDQKIRKIKIPNMQYRGDIYKSTKKRYIEMQRNGWFK